MANIKFSSFTTETNPANVDFLVGYEGTTMKKIDPANVSGGAAYPFLIDTASLYSGFVPSSLSGNPQNNTTLGISAGLDLTTGTQNTLIGNLAGENVIGQFGTTAVGYKAGSTQNAESYNTYIGNEAGRDHVGAQSVFVGGGTRVFSSGQNSDGVVTVGYAAHDQKAGPYSVAIGYSAGNQASGTGSVYIGRDAGKTNVATGMVALGYEAARSSVGGNGKIAVGYRAGYSNTSGSWNTNIGYFASYSNSTGSRNVVLGTQSGYNNIGDDGVFIGYQAGYQAASSLNRNTMVGAYAGRDVGSTRFSNTFIGYGSGRYYNSNLNCFIGSETGRGNSSGATGSTNTAVGGNCFQNSTTSSSVVAMGYQCLRNGANTGNNIVAIGANIHVSDTITGSNLIILGEGASASSTSVSNEITLGDSNITALRIPGLQSGASDGDVLTFSSGTGKITLQAAGGGGGASSLNGLSDVLIDGTSSYFINIPSGLSGNPAGNLVIGNSAGNSLTTGLGNIAIGNQALSSGTIAQQNVAIGNECLPLVTGNSNVAVGYFAGKLSTSASNNTFIGNTAGQQNSQGDGNTFVGKAAGFWNTTLGDNTYIGMNSGSVLGQKNVSSGVRSLAGTFAAVSESVAIGYEAGTNSQAGQVTFVGSEAGRANTAVGSISVGYQSGYTQTSGARNTNIGYQAGYSVSTSSSNTHIGYQAGRYHNTPGNVLIGEYAGSSAAWALVGGTVVGQNAGLRLQYGDGITAIGRYAAQGVTGTQGARQGCTFVGEYSGSYANSNFNTVVGSFALYGVDNVSNPNQTVAVGYEALYATTTGDQNTVVGYRAGKNITSSPDNVFIGHSAGINFNNTGGDGRNVAVGSGAGNDLTTGIYNTFLGYQAGALNTNITTGNFNVMVGYQAVGSGTTASNQNSFGYSAACTANNQITLGNTSIGAIRAQVTSITAISDERDKTSIETIPYGLEFVNSLQPKKFVWDHRAETDSEGNEFFSSNKGKKDIGFIAQDVQKVIPELVRENDNGMLSMRHQGIAPILLEAIKELKAEIEELKFNKCNCK